MYYIQNGDLVHRIYLQATLPAVTVASANSGNWVFIYGEKLINYVEIEIGGQKIDKHFGEWLHIWNQLSNNSGHEEGYQRMVGNIPKLCQRVNALVIYDTDETELYVPLQFGFAEILGFTIDILTIPRS